MSINKSFTESNFASVLDEYKYNLNLGDIVAGTIFSIEKKGFLVDIGIKIAGYLPYEEVLLSNNISNNYLHNINSITREFFLLAYNKSSQQLILSIKRLEYIRGWKRIKQIETENIILNLNIRSNNKGGIITYLEGIRGFIPNSHIARLSSIDERYIQCKILLADEKYNKLILSHKKALLCTTTNKLKIGDIVYGKITKVENYGVFIEIYGMPSLLHISEIGHKNIQNINKIFQVGNTITVKILHIDTQQGRLSVSTKNI
uniref:ribosomal protein S1 n=1 Tax=Catenella fusiformis TaxID=3024791 RepID=UPI0027DA3A1F|nr:ribosomal protein S1 [Catenella fusiformis]WCH57613.1 ribosomal protein S1 [Catenella fusiformis]